MLSGIDPLLSGELLLHLDRMGHSDLVAIVDAHFPAYRLGPVAIEIASDAPSVVRAVCSVIQLDDVNAVALMASGAGWSDVQRLIVDAADIDPTGVDEIDRFSFYERATKAQVIVRTAEGRTYGNVLLSKGVTPPYHPAP